MLDSLCRPCRCAVPAHCCVEDTGRPLLLQISPVSVPVAARPPPSFNPRTWRSRFCAQHCKAYIKKKESEIRIHVDPPRTQRPSRKIPGKQEVGMPPIQNHPRSHSLFFFDRHTAANYPTSRGAERTAELRERLSEEGEDGGSVQGKGVESSLSSPRRVSSPKVRTQRPWGAPSPSSRLCCC